MVQAGQKFRSISRATELPSRTLDAALGNLSDEQGQRKRGESRGTDLARRTLGSGIVAGGVAKHARGFGLGHAAMAARMVRARPAGRIGARGRRGIRKCWGGGRREVGSAAAGSGYTART